MKFNDLIAFTAVGTGVVQMYLDFENSDEVNVKFKNSIIFGVIGTTTWLIYYMNDTGMSPIVMYTLISLVLQLYVLNKILLKEKDLK